MNVLYIYDGDWPRGATRVRKQTAVLAEAGHNVRLLARNEERAARRQIETWMEVRRLPTVPGRLTNRLLNFPFFLSPVWLWEMLLQGKGWAQAIVVEDLPLAPSALFIGRLLRVPVFYDMGEVYPEFLKGLWEVQGPSLIDRVVRNPRAAAVLERFVLRRAHHTFVVSEESRSRALARGAHSSRITIVGNTPENVDDLVRCAEVPITLRPYLGRRMVLFTGILIFDRGLAPLVESIDLLRRDYPDVLLVLVGDGPDSEAIRELTRIKGLEANVLMCGWQQHEDLPCYYQHAAVGVLPFYETGQIRFTLANKLFDYMGAGLPVVASDVRPMRRILEETQSGILVEPGSASALADGIGRVFALSPEERIQLGLNGRRAVENKYNWNVDGARFVSRVVQREPQPL